jgi:hypothetical protein
MKENMIPVAAKIPADLAEAVARLADAGDRSMSGEIRRAIREHVDRSGASRSSLAPDVPAAHVRDPESAGSRTRTPSAGPEEPS